MADDGGSVSRIGSVCWDLAPARAGWDLALNSRGLSYSESSVVEKGSYRGVLFELDVGVLGETCAPHWH